MNHYVSAAKAYLKEHKKDIIAGLPVPIGIIIIAVIIGSAIYANSPHVVYQPAKACDLLTPSKAEDLLGNKVLSSDQNSPAISGNVATSKCSYTDENPDENAMKVLALAVQSGINETGVKQNKAGFTSSKPKSSVEDVKGLGQSAYFNKANGQLNILDGRRWIILSYGIGSTPQDNTLDDALILAHKVLG